VILFLKKIIINKYKIKAPIKNLIPLKINGPIDCMPTFWATKANPQIIEAENKIIVEKMCLFIVAD